MAAQKPTIIIIVLATFSVSHSLRIKLNRQRTAAQDGTHQHTVAADELYRLSRHCPEVKSVYAGNLVMWATCEREYREDILKINKLEAALSLQLVTTPDELDRRQQQLEEEVNGHRGASCEQMETATVTLDKLIGQYGQMKYLNLARMEHLKAQFNAHPIEQRQRQALVRSEFTRRTDLIDALEKGYQQDTQKIDKLQATLLGLQRLAMGDDLYRCLVSLKCCSKRGCEEMEAAKVIKSAPIDKHEAMKFAEERVEIHACIEELKKEPSGRSESSCEEMEAAKGIQGKLIGKYKEMKYLNSVAIEGLTTQIDAHLTAQIEKHAWVRSEFAHRNNILGAYEKEHTQDALRINDLLAAMGIQELAAADEINRRILRIEQLKKEFNCCSTRSYKEMEAAKDLRDELIDKYGELRHVSLATISALEEKAAGKGEAKKVRSKGKDKATMQN